jgi:hypothetical protein
VSLTQLGLSMPVSVGVLSPTQVLSTSLSINNFMLAAASAMNAQGNTAAATVLNNMILNAATTGTVKLGDVVNVVSGGEPAAATASLNLLQLLTASAFVLEKNGGHALSIPMAGITLPGGIASVTASATVIEPPQVYIGPVGGPSIHTGQVRLSITPVVNLGINLLGLAGLGVYGNLPIDLTVAGATGTLTGINCATPSITVNTVTQAVNLNTDLSLNVRANVLFIPVDVARLTLDGGAKTTPTNQNTTFNYPSEFWPTMTKSVGASNLGLDGLLDFTNADVQILNGIISLGQIATTVIPAVNTLLGNLDNVLVKPLMKALGLKLGGADIAAFNVNCNGLRLAG